MRASLIDYAPPLAAGGVFFLAARNILDSHWPESSVFLMISTVILLLPVGSLFFACRLHGHIRPFHVCNKSKCTASLELPILALLGALLIGVSLQTAGIIDRLNYVGLEIDAVDRAQVRLISDPSISGRGRWIAEGRLMNVGNENIEAGARGRITVAGGGVPSDLSELGTGRIIRVNGRIHGPESQWKEDSFLIFADNWRARGWISSWHRARHLCISAVEQPLERADPETRSFLTALLLGKRTDSGSPLMRGFRNAGCMHLLALSGFHVGLLAVFLKISTRPIFGQTASLIVSSIGVLFFLILAGSRPSLLRAAIMYLIWTLESLRHHRFNPLSIISAAFVIQTVFCPRAVSLISFQLSYAALFGILTGGRALFRLLSRRIPGSIWSVFSAGVGAQAAAMPFVISSFGIWRPIGLLAAPILTPLLVLSMGSGTALIILDGLPQDMVTFAWSMAGKLVAAITRIAESFGRASGIELKAHWSWSIAAAGIILPLIITRRLRYELPNNPEPRLPGLNPSVPGQ